MKVFISYHRADAKYRRKVENILIHYGIDYYAVPDNADVNGKTAEEIKTFLCVELKKCDVMICLIGKETYSRPHVDREIHEALKGIPGQRLGIIGVILPSRDDSLQNIDLNTFPAKLWDNKEYVVWTEWKGLNDKLKILLQDALNNSVNKKMQTNHTNKCMQLRSTIYYDN